MPLKIDVGVSQKLGQPNYSSVGASCNVQFEADSSLLEQDLATFRARVRHAAAACRKAVKEELARYRASPSQADVRGNGVDENPSAATAVRRVARANGNGSAGNGITERQLHYLRKLADEIPDVGAEQLEPMAEALFGKSLERLDSGNASEMIDLLKGILRGEIDPGRLVQGVAS